MLHGSFLHGEWFLEGQRCPGGDHRQELPPSSGLTERPPGLAEFPEARRRLDIFDGCPNQFAYGDNFHQIAIWHAKTARWAKHRLAEASAKAAAASAVAADAAAVAADCVAAAASTASSAWARVPLAVPNAPFHVRAAATTHRLAAAAAVASSKAATSAHTTSTNAASVADSAVLSADAASAAAKSATATQRLTSKAAAAASTASAAASAAALDAIRQGLTSAASAASLASASAAAGATAATAVANAITPTTEDERPPLSPAAKAAVASSPSLDGIIRMAMKLVEHHGKGGCDGNSMTVVLALKHAILHKLIGPHPGTRELVLFLAEHKPKTSTPKELKRGWEAIGRIFYGYMNTDLFTKTVVADADGSKFQSSQKHHSFIGQHTSAQVFQDGELQACHEFCPCSSCLLGRYNCCTLKSEMGTMVGCKT